MNEETNAHVDSRKNILSTYFYLQLLLFKNPIQQLFKHDEKMIKE